MKAHTLFTKATAGIGSLALAFAMSACSHHTSMAEQSGQNTGEIRTEQAATQSTSSGETLGTAPAPANTQGTVSNPGTPAVISGPAAVDSTGRVYTSSSVGSSGNASAVGTNTNVNIVPKNGSSSTLVTESTAPAPTVTIETPAPAPAPVIVETTPVETPAPAPVVVETPAPMTSSTTTTETTTTTQTRHRRLRKD